MGAVSEVLERFLRQGFVPSAELSVVSRREVLLIDMVVEMWIFYCGVRSSSLAFEVGYSL